MDPAIVTEGLTKRYRDRVVVDSVDLSVQEGEIFGFLGPNGAGKTTTIGMLLGLIRPSAGRAALLGHDVAQQPEQALSGVGAMIETPAFYPYLSGRDNLRVLALAGGLPRERVESVLATVELADRARDSFRTYSLGMKQRLGIAAALLHDPKLIILDEPTNGLDPAGQLEIRELIRTLATRGHTIFLSSHMLHEVEQICERVAILRQGKIVTQGRVADLLRRGQGLLVRVAGDAAAAQRLLAGLDWVRSVAPHEGALLVDAPAERAPEITMLLAAQAIPVAEIRAHQERLEDLFLEVTR
jgi:ABC-2 type transport system ATP-binding protein